MKLVYVQTSAYSGNGITGSSTETDVATAESVSNSAVATGRANNLGCNVINYPGEIRAILMVI